MNDINKNENKKHYREQQSHHHHNTTTSSSSSSSSFSLLCCHALDTTIITNMMPSSSSTITNNNSNYTDTSPPKKSNKMENDPTNHHNGNHSHSNNGFMGRLFHNANRTIHHLTTKKYALPDKIVASQILMYRQLLHTTCRNNLILSRPYKATPAQISVQHMPWWETTTTVIVTTTTDKGDEGKTTTPTTTTTTTKIITMVDTGKMVISYENLIQRLWNAGLAPYYYNNNNNNTTTNDCDMNNNSSTNDNMNNNDDTTNTTTIKPSCSMIIPHPIWVSILGFQQSDPVTDFRSGGILSLALMVWIVEHCPTTYSKFISHNKGNNMNQNHHHYHYPTTTTTTTAHHPASVLPFGITSINITDMLAKLLMLSKKFDRMDALMSQTPFWPLFHDPYAILTLQELSLELLCGIVKEIVTLRQVEEEIRQQVNSSHNTSHTSSSTPTGTTVDILSGLDDDNNNNNSNSNDSTNPPMTMMNNNIVTPSTNTTSSHNNDYSKYISVFDFTQILSMTEERVEYDLLGSGPRTIDELRNTIYTQTLLPKYQQQLQLKIQKLWNQQQQLTKKVISTTTTTTVATLESLPEPQQPQQQQLHEKVLHHATHGIGHLFSSVSSHHNSLWKNGMMNHILSSHNKTKENSNDNSDPTLPVASTKTTETPTIIDLFDTDVVNHTTNNSIHKHDVNDDDWMNHQQQYENIHNDQLTNSNESNGHNNNTILYDDMFDAIDLNDRRTVTGTTTTTTTTADTTTSASMFCITDE